MTSQELERLLSTRPKFTGSGSGHKQEAPCLRDMVFDYFCGKYKDTERANEATKEYTDHLYSLFVNRTA